MRYYFGVIGVLLLVSVQSNAVKADSGVRVLNESAPRPHLIFACDRPSGELHSLFTSQLIAELKDLGAGIALSTEDFSVPRAQLVRELNSAGIPVIAWIVLPKTDGYYVNAGNEPQVAARFAQFDKWTIQNGLHWQAAGLDIEPNFSEFAALRGHKWQLFWTILGRYFHPGRVYKTREAYAALIREMQARGYSVQTYQLMFLVHERQMHSTLLERIFGIVDVRGDEEVLMLYSSFAPQLGAALIWKFGPDAQEIAVGSTSSDDPRYPALNWTQFSRDLLVAHHFSQEIGVYNLEGCVQQGFLPLLLTMDWTKPVTIPAGEIEQANRFSELAELALWFAAHILYFVAAFLLLIVWLGWRIVRRRRNLHSVHP